MDNENINYHWLKNSAEKRQVIDRILMIFDDRKVVGLESVETMAERAMDDEDILSADQIIREFPHICASVWRDDLYDSESYTRALQKMIDIAPSVFPISDIRDGSTDSTPGELFEVSLKSGDHVSRISLKNQRWLDFDFLKLLLQALEHRQATGKYYWVESETMDEGFVFLYLEPEQHHEVLSSGMFELYKLDADRAEEIASIHRETEKPKSTLHTAPEVLETLRKTSKPTDEKHTLVTSTEINTEESRSVYRYLAIPIAILLVLFTLMKFINSVTRSMQHSEPVISQPVTNLSPEVLVAQRKIALQIVGSPPVLDQERFERLQANETHDTMRNRMLGFYRTLLSDQEVTGFGPVLAYTPEGSREISTLVEFNAYAAKYFKVD